MFLDRMFFFSLCITRGLWKGSRTTKNVSANERLHCNSCAYGKKGPWACVSFTRALCGGAIVLWTHTLDARAAAALLMCCSQYAGPCADAVQEQRPLQSYPRSAQKHVFTFPWQSSVSVSKERRSVMLLQSRSVCRDGNSQFMNDWTSLTKDWTFNTRGRQFISCFLATVNFGFFLSCKLHHSPVLN